jgi:lipid II:glycine glycyltransferase (peptidoglycan interpeptide bridge formation enzyme)
MSNFYQSQLRTHILRDIYKRSTFEVDFLDKKYMGQMKEKSKFGLSARWYMVHGIELENVNTYDAQIADGLKRLKRDFWKHWWDMMFQLGIVNTLESLPTNDYKNPEVIEQNKKTRSEIQSDYKTRYNLTPTLREHMPEATVVLDLYLEDSLRQKSYSESGRRYINKAKRAELSFAVATAEEWKLFYDMWYTTAFDKGFWVIPRAEYDHLIEFLTIEKRWQLFLAKKGQEIVSGSICLLDGKNMTYLYGATDRSYGDIGGHYWLTDQIASRAHDQGYMSLDLLGIAPLWHPEHHLAGVSRFKQAFGGQTISYIGNYDCVFNGMLYKGFGWMRG